MGGLKLLGLRLFLLYGYIKHFINSWKELCLRPAKYEGFHVPVPRDYYRVKQLDEGLLKKILDESTKLFFGQNGTLNI
jgi:hypothetical protein